jgi:hypothetical protein
VPTDTDIPRKELARRIGLEPCSRTLQDIELGKKPLDPEVVSRISVETGCPVGWLLDDRPWGKRMPTLSRQRASQDTSLAEMRRLPVTLGKMLGTRLTTELANKIRRIPHAPIAAQITVKAVGTVLGGKHKLKWQPWDQLYGRADRFQVLMNVAINHPTSRMVSDPAGDLF